jgi:EAL domain-containing protein (putative c-di-GMP-specific phosphodiesterase class I)
MHPRLGAVSPAKVIPIAEETGLIVPLGDWVIEQVCRQLRSWAKDGMCIVPVAINVSTLQLIHVDFAERLMQTLDRYEIAPSWIHLEVTETAAMSNLDEVSVQIAELSGRGISFSIDDFGTGHSSLGRLHQLAFSELKIDRSFTEQLCRDKQSTLTIVQAIISMAHALGKTVVAEGVETETQLACLRELECDRIQGFLISRPVDPGEIPALMTMVHAVFKSVTSISDRVVA